MPVDSLVLDGRKNGLCGQAELLVKKESFSCQRHIHLSRFKLQG